MPWSFSMIRTRSVATICLIALGLPLEAQDPAQNKKDPQSSFEPRSNPGAGQKFLQKFVGDWDVAKTFHLRAGDPVRMTGQCRQTMVHDGRFLKSEFVFDYNGVKSAGTGLIGFEAESGKFTSVWIDSRSTRMSMRQSQGTFNGEEIVLYSGSLREDGKNPRRTRTVTRLEDEGRKLIHRQYMPGQDGKERLMMELLMTRKAETP
jgi:hypothetical protein